MNFIKWTHFLCGHLEFGANLPNECFSMAALLIRFNSVSEEKNMKHIGFFKSDVVVNNFDQYSLIF